LHGLLLLHERVKKLGQGGHAQRAHLRLLLHLHLFLLRQVRRSLQLCARTTSKTISIARWDGNLAELNLDWV
jgi:hypothetical protein